MPDPRSPPVPASESLSSGAPTEAELLDALNVASGYLEELPIPLAEAFATILEAIRVYRAASPSSLGSPPAETCNASRVLCRDTTKQREESWDGEPKTIENGAVGRAGGSTPLKSTPALFAGKRLAETADAPPTNEPATKSTVSLGTQTARDKSSASGSPPELKKLLKEYRDSLVETTFDKHEPNCACVDYQDCNCKVSKRMIAARSAIEALFASLELEIRRQREEGMTLEHRLAFYDTALAEKQKEIERLRRFETYVCQVIAMGNQADLTVEALPR